jgi:hypothetical protein
VVLSASRWETRRVLRKSKEGRGKRAEKEKKRR